MKFFISYENRFNRDFIVKHAIFLTKEEALKNAEANNKGFSDNVMNNIITSIQEVDITTEILLISLMTAVSIDSWQREVLSMIERKDKHCRLGHMISIK
jgi:hypothetical protein